MKKVWFAASVSIKICIIFKTKIYKYNGPSSRIALQVPGGLQLDDQGTRPSQLQDGSDDLRVAKVHLRERRIGKSRLRFGHTALFRGDRLGRFCPNAPKGGLESNY